MHVTCIITCAISHFNPHIDWLADSTRAVCVSDLPVMSLETSLEVII